MSRYRKQQRYEKLVQAEAERLLAEGKAQPGTVHTIAVRHDDSCALLKGEAACNCNPIVDAPKRVPSPDEN